MKSSSAETVHSLRDGRSKTQRRVDDPAYHHGSSSDRLSVCDQAVLLTVVYADLFDFPLKRDEISSRLVGHRFERAAVRESLERLTGRQLSCSGEFVFLDGRDDLVSVRRRRSDKAKALWNGARRYARWLARVPFVRMVAVSGSLAVDNSSESSDVDLFCITETNRLWIARLFFVALSKMTRLFPSIFPLYLCPNYVVSRAALRVEYENLFTAHEVLQAVPLFDTGVCRDFLRANDWARDLLPHLTSREHPLSDSVVEGSTAARAFERILSGRRGDLLNRLIHRAFTYFYRRRARQKGWHWDRLAPAYQRERYTVPEGGYASVIARLFRRRIEDVTGSAVPPSEIDRLFPVGQESEATCYDWSDLFSKEYGVEARDAA